MRVKLEKRGVLGAGQVQKGGSLPRHIPILNIYVSTPPPPPPGCRSNIRPCSLFNAAFIRTGDYRISQFTTLEERSLGGSTGNCGYYIP